MRSGRTARDAHANTTTTTNNNTHTHTEAVGRRSHRVAYFHVR